jgi:hypothetical protein
VCVPVVHKETIGEILGRCRETVLSVDTLVADDYFNSFTQPIINNKVINYGTHSATFTALLSPFG